MLGCWSLTLQREGKGREGKGREESKGEGGKEDGRMGSVGCMGREYI